MSKTYITADALDWSFEKGRATGFDEGVRYATGHFAGTNADTQKGPNSEVDPATLPTTPDTPIATETVPGVDISAFHPHWNEPAGTGESVSIPADDDDWAPAYTADDIKPGLAFDISTDLAFNNGWNEALTFAADHLSENISTLVSAYTAHGDNHQGGEDAVLALIRAEAERAKR